MTWKPIILTASVLAVGGIGYAAFRYFNKQKALLLDYSIEPIDIKLSKRTPEQWVVDFTVRLTNKSAIDATLSRLYADIYINDVNIGYVTDTSTVAIPAKGTADIKLQLSFAPKAIIGNAVDLLLGILTAKNMTYRLKGYVKLSSGFIPVPEIPFDETGSIKDFIT